MLLIKHFKMYRRADRLSNLGLKNNKEKNQISMRKVVEIVTRSIKNE